MTRMFQTHRIRKSREADPVWTLTTPDEGGLEQPEKTVVPGVWESHPRLRNYRGRGIYEQVIRCGGNVRFFFGGVSFRARVILDGCLLAEHYGAYTGFEAAAAGVQPGEHILRVEADNRFGDDSALHIPNDYYAYGGINRPVLIEEVPDAYITYCHARPLLTENGWKVNLETGVRNLSSHAMDGIVAWIIAGKETRQSFHLPPGEDGIFRAEIACGQVREWSPEQPELYEIRAVLELDGEAADDLAERIGFREIRTEGKQLLLNGKPLRLKGLNRHEEYGSFGLAVPPEAMMQDLHLMKDLGANCVRTCHYPNDPRFLDLCDETGMLVWEESHARGLSEERMRHPRFREQLAQCNREMVQQHFNHPSIFLWGCLNECADDTEYGAACYRESFAMLRAMDPGRPVTAALLERPGGLVYKDMDVIGINLYPKWYIDQPPAESLDRKKKEIAAGGGGGRPIIVSETGAGAIYGYHDPFGEAKWSEERQCAILREQIRAVLADPDVCGVFLWQFADVRVADEWFASRPKTYNNKGLLDEYRRPKMAYRTVQELFRESV